MDGVRAYELKKETALNNVLNANSDFEYLQGFKNFIIPNNTINTVLNYVRAVLAFMKYTGNKKLSELTVDDYSAYLYSLKNKSSSYQITRYSALKKFSRYLYARNLNSEDAMRFISRPKYKETVAMQKKREAGFLTKDEIRDYIFAVKNNEMKLRSKWHYRDLAILELFLETGMRCAALNKLNLESIDMTTGKLVTVDKGEEIQEYELSGDMLRALSLYERERKNFLLKKNIKEDALFINQYGSRLGQGGIADVVTKYASSVPGKKLSPHKLRATYGTQLYEETKDLFLVQECMGHKDPKITKRYIRGQKTVSRRRASSIMADIISK